jgi:hypothetical protein
MEESTNTVSSGRPFDRLKLNFKSVNLQNIKKVDLKLEKSIRKINSYEQEDFSDIREMLSLLSPTSQKECNFENSTLDSDVGLVISPLSSEKSSKNQAFTPGRTLKRKEFIIRTKIFPVKQSNL